VNWFARKAVALATITLYIRHHKDDNNVEHIDIDQKLAGIPGAAEKRTLDWTFRERSDPVFGPILGKFRRAPLDQIDNEFLRNGWLPDTEQNGAIHAYVKSDNPKSGKAWTLEQVCQPFNVLLPRLSQNALICSDLGVRRNPQ
jgi:hypothetical protein